MDSETETQLSLLMVTMNKLFSLYHLIFCLFLLVAAFPAKAEDECLSNPGECALKCGVSVDIVKEVHSSVAQGKLSEKLGASLLNQLLEACVEQFPMAPFENKLAEGLVKGVPGQSIVGVLGKRLEGYRFSRELLLTSVGRLDDDALIAMGEGLAMHVAPSDFKRYASEFADLSPESFMTGLFMVSYLGQVNFNYSLTEKIVSLAVEKNAFQPQWRHFIRVVQAARSKGMDDATICNAALEALKENESVADVLPRLGFTRRDLSGQGEMD